MTISARMLARLIRICVAFVVAIIGVSLAPSLAFATSIPAGGVSQVSGGCTWTLTEEGVLTVAPTPGDTGVLRSMSINAPWARYASGITKAVFEPGVIAGAGLHGLFLDCSQLDSIKFGDLDTSNTTDMSSMFNGCSSLTEIDISELDTSNVQYIGDMFRRCSSLKTVNLSGLNLQNVSTMGGLFAGCTNLKSVNLAYINTPSITSTMTMFQGCESLESVNLSDLDTANVTSMSSMFAGCTSLSSISLAELNLQNVADMTSMFFGCSSLESVSIPVATPSLERMQTMFCDCSALATLNLSGINTESVENMNLIFDGCSSLDMVTLGGNFSFYGNGSSENPMTLLPAGLWFSRDVENFFTVQQIANDRAYIPDTYTLGLDKINIQNTSVAASPLTFVYDGSAQTPNVTLTYQGETLVLNTDYTIVASDNVNAGNSASLTITGIGNYEGEVIVPFEITPVNISGASVSIASQTYVDRPLYPSATVTVNGVTLKSGTDYSISYKNNDDVGKAAAIITGRGNYTGTIEAGFEILPVNVTGKWVKSGSRWWFKYDQTTASLLDASYPADEWVSISGSTYHFDSSGWMQTGWQKIDGSWHYFKGSGAMVSGWFNEGGTWYLLDPEDGKMQTGWESVDGAWYYFSGSGAMQTGWTKLGGAWYFMKPSGAMLTGWLDEGGAWYFLKANGAMATGWQQVKNSWYCFAEPGVMRTGWVKSGRAWYYLRPSGSMVANAWVGNYWMQQNGAMAVNKWVDGGTYYVGSSGAWVPGKRR